jgi:hypothetical protein
MVTRKGGSRDLENLTMSVGESSRHVHASCNASTKPRRRRFLFVLRNESDNNAGNETDSNVLIVDEEAANVEAAVTR